MMEEDQYDRKGDWDKSSSSSAKKTNNTNDDDDDDAVEQLEEMMEVSRRPIMIDTGDDDDDDDDDDDEQSKPSLIVTSVPPVLSLVDDHDYCHRDQQQESEEEEESLRTTSSSISLHNGDGGEDDDDDDDDNNIIMTLVRESANGNIEHRQQKELQKLAELGMMIPVVGNNKEAVSVIADLNNNSTTPSPPPMPTSTTTTTATSLPTTKGERILTKAGAAAAAAAALNSSTALTCDNSSAEESSVVGPFDDVDIMDAVIKRASMEGRVVRGDIEQGGQDGGDPLPNDDDDDDDDAAPQQPLPVPVAHPGAFSGAPGQGLRRQEDLRFSLVGRISLHRMRSSRSVRASLRSSQPSSSLRDISMADVSDTSLSVAKLILASDDSDDCSSVLTEAQPVNLVEQTRTRRQKQFFYRLLHVLCCGVVLILLLVVLLVFLLPQQQGDAQQQQQRDGPIKGNDDSAKELLLEESSSSSSMEQSSSFYQPQEEEEGRRTMLLSLLPDFTKIALEDTESPQSRAFQWIVDDPGFMNFTEDRIVQRFALSALYFSSGGDDWFNNTNWLSYEHHECQWYVSSATETYLQSGILNNAPPVYLGWIQDMLLQSPPCEDYPAEETFTHLWLFRNGLRGIVPPEVYLLQSLKSLALGLNPGLAGSTISPLIGNLSSLKVFSMGYTGLKGIVPTEIGLLSSLEQLWLGKNGIKSIPTELGLLSQNLGVLSLEENQLSGTVPPTLGSLGNLSIMNLGNNHLSGSIPSQLGKLEKVAFFSLHSNHHTGEIPSQIGMLRNATDITFRSNGLTGTVPLELTRLVAANGRLQRLYLYDNNILGTIPEDLCLIETVSDYNSNLIGCNCTCSFLNPHDQGRKLCSPLPDRCL